MSQYLCDSLYHTQYVLEMRLYVLQLENETTCEWILKRVHEMAVHYETSKVE